MDMLQWAKDNAKEGANVAEFEEALERAMSLDSLLERKDVKAELDRRITDTVERHDKRFREEKLPSMLEEERARLAKELNPEETPEQKRIRELEEKLTRAEKQRQAEERKAAIRNKAKELQLDRVGLAPEDVEPFAAFGDEADQVLESFAAKFSKQFENTMSERLKERFGDTPPPAKEPEAEAEPYDFKARMEQTFLGNQ